MLDTAAGGTFMGKEIEIAKKKYSMTCKIITPNGMWKYSPPRR
jgi:hypothetical protein